MTGTPSLEAVVRRARTDPIGRLIATVDKLGVRFRFAGAAFQVAGAGSLCWDDQVVLQKYMDDIRARLAPPATTPDLVGEQGVEIEVVTDADRARQVVADLSPGLIGCDIETAPDDGVNGYSWIKVTRTGRRAVRQEPVQA